MLVFARAVWGWPCRQWRAIRGATALIVAFTGLVLAVIVGATLQQIVQDRAVTEAAMRQKAVDLARAFDARLSDRIERLDHALTHVRNDLGPCLGTGTACPQKIVYNSLDRAVIQVAVLDAQGHLVASTLPFTPGEDFSDREHFRTHLDHPATTQEDRLHIGRPVLGRLSQRWSVYLTRRIDGADGRFAGVVGLAIDPFQLAELADDLPIGSQGVISLFGMDRVLRMFHTQHDDPARRAWVGRELPLSPEFLHPDRPASGVSRVVSIADGRPFISAYRRLANYPLAVTLQLSEEEAFHPAEERARFLKFGAIGVSLVIGLCAGMLAKATSTLRRNEQILEQRVAERTVELEASHLHVRKLAYYDPLTDLPNRAFFMDNAARAIQAAGSEGRALALLFLDLDRFKEVNDTLGHAAGDDLLVAMAGRLCQTVAAPNAVARLGGDEFVILLENLADEAEAMRTAARILAAARSPVTVCGRELHTSGSMGVALFPRDGNDLPTLFKSADTAMYAAKEAGRNTVRRFDPAMGEAIERRLAMGRDLLRGLQEGQFVLFFQPKVNLASGELQGVEALLRWRHPERGWIPPAEFIPFAEETGLIEPLGTWVIEEACRAIAAWDVPRHGPLRVAVNAAAAQIVRGDLPATLAAVARRHGIDPRFIEIEVTETAVIGDMDRAKLTLEGLRTLGVSVALDDFGTGYSGLTYLRQFSIDTIKIDRSFLQDTHPNCRNAELTRLVVQMAKTLRLSVVGEGVETEAQRAFLRDCGCDAIQGYLVARPMPLPDLKAWVTAEGRLS